MNHNDDKSDDLSYQTTYALCVTFKSITPSFTMFNVGRPEKT